MKHTQRTIIHANRNGDFQDLFGVLQPFNGLFVNFCELESSIKTLDGIVKNIVTRFGHELTLLVNCFAQRFEKARYVGSVYRRK
jgi:hypothetical protein